VNVVCNRAIENGFEERIFSALATCPLDGIATNNVIIPNVQFRDLPDEHDLLVLLAGRVYTLEAKELWPGSYRGPSGGDWEYRAPGGTAWEPATFGSHPLEIAFKKGKKLESYVKDRIRDGAGGGMRSVPEVVSSLIVTDHADISGLGWRPDGKITSGARLLMTGLGRLNELLAADAAFQRQSKPTLEQLAAFFEVDRPNDVSTLPCSIDKHVRLLERMRTAARPITRSVYRGELALMGVPTRVEVVRKFEPARPGTAVSPEIIRRALRASFRAVQQVVHPAVLRCYHFVDTPAALTLAYEYCDDATLEDILARRRLSWDEVRAVFRTVVEALRAAHRARVYHRFLDPSCILVKEQDLAHPRVHAFYGSLVQDLSTIGISSYATSDLYIAPEAGGSYSPELLDAYSIGRCLAAALTGDPEALPADGEAPAPAVAAVEDLVLSAARRGSAWERLPALLGP
jgi:hypothetical protein